MGMRTHAEGPSPAERLEQRYPADAQAVHGEVRVGWRHAQGRFRVFGPGEGPQELSPVRCKSHAGFSTEGMRKRAVTQRALSLSNCVAPAWGDHHPSMFGGTERFFQPGYRAHLVPEWLPALEGVVPKLEAGATVADVGCGMGRQQSLWRRPWPKPLRRKRSLM